MTPDPSDDLDPNADYDPASLLHVDEALLGPWPDDEPDDDAALLLQQRVEVEWQTQCELPAHGLTVPVILDPTRANSHWLGAPEDVAQPVLIHIGSLAFHVTLHAEAGEPTIILGRDAIANRISIVVPSS